MGSILASGRTLKGDVPGMSGIGVHRMCASNTELEKLATRVFMRLVGGPGCGKEHWAERVAVLLLGKSTNVHLIVKLQSHVFICISVMKGLVEI